MEEAERYLKDGDKATQKSFFKKPNWDAAASHFEKAAQKFAALGMTAKAHETWNRAADAHAKAGNWFFVGRNYEAVANSCKMAKEYDQTADYLEKAAEAYVTANQLDKSADMLSDAAKAILARYPFGFSDKLGDAAAMQRVDRAISLLQASYDRHIDVERYHAVPPVYQTLLTTIVRRKKYVDAANAIRHYCTRVAGDALNRPHEVAHGLLEEVGLRLTAGGLADADDALQAALARSPAVMGTAAYSLAGAIVDAVRDMDADALADAVKHQVRRHTRAPMCLHSPLPPTAGAHLHQRGGLQSDARIPRGARPAEATCRHAIRRSSRGGSIVPRRSPDGDHRQPGRGRGRGFA